MKNKIVLLFSFFVLLLPLRSWSSYIYIPMNESQKDHLKSYGVAYWVLSKDIEVEWLLNYEGGSFAFVHNGVLEKECLVRGVTYQVISDAKMQGIRNEIALPEVNMEVVKLQKSPKLRCTHPKPNNPGMMR
jgi:hypothetical protein